MNSIVVPISVINLQNMQNMHYAMNNLQFMPNNCERYHSGMNMPAHSQIVGNNICYNMNLAENKPKAIVHNFSTSTSTSTSSQ